jgi:Sulfotransferase domain
MSLKVGLELLLGQPCYHMAEVFGRPEHVMLWKEAAEGGTVDWTAMLADYGATSDFPACLFWPEILAANPDAMVVLSTRRDSAEWWDSASHTIFSFVKTQIPPEMSEWFDMWQTVASARFTPNWNDEHEAKAAYERHNAEVRASVPPDRLLVWQARDGWGPLCLALGVDEPDEPFPHLNTREGFPQINPDIDLAQAVEDLRQPSQNPAAS